MRNLIAVVFVLCSSVAFGQIDLSYSKSLSLTGVTAPRIAGERILVGADSKPSVVEVAIIKASSPSKFLKLKARKSLFEFGKLDQISDTEWVLSGSGKWIIEASAFDPDRGIDESILEVTIGGKPDPKPDPEPEPEPEPQPSDDLPFAGDGLRVLIVYESSDLASLTEKQRQVLYSKEIRDYLSAKCAKSEKGIPEWRVLDKDADTSKEAKQWTDAMARKRGNLPWIAISNGKSGIECELPATIQEAAALLKKYGGAL